MSSLIQDMKSHSSIYQYDRIFTGLPMEFNDRATEVFKYQYLENPLYRNFSDRLHKSPGNIVELKRIPFLPVSFFKTEVIKAGNFDPEMIFESSGTTGTEPSRHFVKHIGLYRESFVKGFELFYG